MVNLMRAVWSEGVAVAVPWCSVVAQYALNLSLSTAEPFHEVVADLAPKLLMLKKSILHAFEVAAQD